MRIAIGKMMTQNVHGKALPVELLFRPTLLFRARILQSRLLVGH